MPLSFTAFPPQWRTIALLLMACALPYASYSQPLTLSGIIQDAETGEKLPYASVTVLGTPLGTASNVDGFFVLLSVPADTLTLVATYLGYEKTRVKVDARVQREPVVINMAATTTSLDEVLVRDERYRMIKLTQAVSQVTLSPKDISALPNIGEVDIFRSLQLLPGISGTNEGSSGLYVRGGTPDQNLILLDGMTVYHVDHFFGFFSAFNADAIKDVQVFKGAFPATYGGRASSVVELTGKTGDLSRFRLGAGVNLLSSNVVAEIPLGGRGALLLSGRRSYTDVLRTGLYTSIYETVTGEDITPESQTAGGPGRPGGALGGGQNGPGQATVQPDFYFYDLNAKLTFLPSPRDALTVSVYNGQDHLDKSRNQVVNLAQGSDNPFNITNDLVDLTDWGNRGLSGRWSRQWGPAFYSNALVAYSEYFSTYGRDQYVERRNPDTDSITFALNLGVVEDNQVSDLTVRLHQEWQATPAHQVRFGVQATQSNARYTFTRDDTLSILNRNQEALQAVAYVQDSWSPLPQMTLTAGLRGVYYDVTRKAYLEPRLGLRWGIRGPFSLKAGWGQFNQFVARVVNENITEGARDFWLLADDASIGVTASTHYVAGLSYETPDWLVDAEAYYKTLSGLTEFSLRFQRTPGNRRSGSPGVGIQADELFFTGEGTAQGIELLLQKKTGTFTGWLSYTLSSINHTFAAFNQGHAFPALHDQRHEVKLVNSLNLGDWSFAATWTLATGKPYTAPAAQYAITLLDGRQQSYIHVGQKNSHRLPAYHRLDLAVHHTFKMGKTSGDVGVSVFNLYNQSNVWYKEFDLSGSPMVMTDVTFLGTTPNVSFRFDL